MQTLLCAGLLIYFRRDYEFHRWHRPIFALATGLLVFFLGIAPQQFFRVPARLVGLNPDMSAAEPPLY